MNRVMQHLRELGLIRVEGHVVRFPSPRKIEEYAGFDGGYLNGAQAPRGDGFAPAGDGHAGAMTNDRHEAWSSRERTIP
jgi:hypothetical protein